MMNNSHPYRGIQAVLTTMHGKEKAVGPPLQETLNITLTVPQGLDTDTLGTFSGEIPRTASPLETARQKAKMGMAKTSLRYGLSTEGSFGPHPLLPFVALHHELLLWIDDELGIEIREQYATPDTNYAFTQAEEGTDLDRFLQQVGFPSHALIVKPHVEESNSSLSVKGIQDHAQLMLAVRRCAEHSQDGLALIQTDMRAHLNPTRLKAIRFAADKLAHRLARQCAGCGCPGFGFMRAVPGLPCEACGKATEAMHYAVEGCPRCAMEIIVALEDRRTKAPQSQCSICNP